MKPILLLLVLLCSISCSETIARKPVSKKTGTYVNTETIKRNKELIAQDEATIQAIIKKDSLREYISSPSGFWYTYEQEDSAGNARPEVGDLVLFNYDVQTIEGKLLKTKEEIGNTITKIDQSNQELTTGLRDGLKIMKQGESITFLFPSHKAYGYYGLEDKVPSNTPIRSTVTLIEIKNQPED